MIQGFLDGLRPEPILTVWEWADKYRYLSSKASSEPGQWRTSRTPYLKEIMEKLSSHDPSQYIVLMKGAQVGATEAGFNWVGYVVDNAPGPMLLVMPTEAMTKRNSTTRFDPMVEASPKLQEKIGGKRTRSKKNTMFQKEFPGGVVVLCGANSATPLRSMPVRYLMLDEVDAYPLDVDGEGSPISLAKARTRTFAKRKVFAASTPTVEGKSIIEKEFLATDQRYFHVPCPECSAMQYLKFTQIKYEIDEAGEAKNVYYECEHCQAKIKERLKTKMLKYGEWMATAPNNASDLKIGYHISALYSPHGWFSWTDVVNDYIVADREKDANKMKAFVNTILGETYKQVEETPEWLSIYNRREEYRIGTCPNGVYFLTAGIDIQKDRIELEVVGWGKNKESWSIDFIVLDGDTTKQEVWEKLTKTLNYTFPTDDGRDLQILKSCIDTGFNTTIVYDFCQKSDPTRVIPIKGNDALSTIVSNPRQVNVTSSGKKIGKMKVWKVGVSLAKGELYAWLKLKQEHVDRFPFGYCHFPMYEEHFFRGLTAEELQFKIVNNSKKFSWVKKYDRNEPLDCRVYARAAASILGIDRMKDEDYDAIRGTVASKEKKKPKQRSKRKSNFW